MPELRDKINIFANLGYYFISSLCFACVSALCLLTCLNAGAVNSIDGYILARIVQSRSNGLDSLALLFSLPVNLSCMCVITAAVLIWSHLKRLRLLFFSCIFSVGGASLCSAALKLSVARSRPGFDFLPIVNEDFFSMPSGHSSSAAALLLTVILYLLSLNISLSAKILYSALSLAAVLGVAWSRLYLAAHYPCDVLAGLMLGAAWACLGFRLAEALILRINRKAA